MLQRMKAVHGKPGLDVTPNRKSTESDSSKIRSKTGHPRSHVLINMELDSGD